jgi:type I restriction enzyme S subunit
MNAGLLLAHFNRISNAPGAVPRLRKFILDLAVRGKLVQQNANDEPASLLAGRASRLALSLDSPPPFSIPTSWVWVRLGDICSKTGSGSTPRGGKSVYQASGVPFLRSQNVYNDGLRLDDVAYISQDTHERMSGTAVAPNDILLNITGGSIGRSCIVRNDLGEANVSQHVAIIRVAIADIHLYLHRLILSPYFQSFVISEQTGAGRGGLPKNRMDQLPVALPPLAEQHRIVARVDELMEVCDRLEAKQRDRIVSRDRLAAASYHHLNNGADAEVLRGHAQFFIKHLPTLTTCTNQLKQLRQSIQTLAVRGKLVPQMNDEETASNLIQRIQAERRDLIRRRVIKAKLLNASDCQGKSLVALPNTWQWLTLGQLLVFGPQNGISPSASSRPDAPKAITLTATTSGVFKPNYFKQIEANIPRDSEFWLRDGDLLFQRGNTREYVGMAAYFDGEDGQFLYPDLIIKVRVSKFVDLRFVHLCSTAPYARAYFGNHATGAQATMPKINHEILLNLPVPLPPIAEQHRIVAKVDDLMALCDQLEASLTIAQTEASRLLESVLHRTLEAQRYDMIEG